MKLAEVDVNRMYSYAEYLKWTFSERVELIRGKIFNRSPAPGLSHARISGKLYYKLSGFLEGKKCEVFSAPFDVRFPGKSADDREIFTVLQPDIVVVCDASKLDERGCLGAPDMVIEILSPGNTLKEQKYKFDIYEEAGVREYWLADPANKCINQYVSDNGRLVSSRPLFEGEVVKSVVLPGFELVVSSVFDAVH